MKKYLIIAVVLAAIGISVVTCSTRKNEPTVPVPTQPAQTPTPGTDGYWSVTSAGITFEWKVNGANLDCKLSAPTTGWVGVGFNSVGQMSGANIIIGYVSGGTATIADCYGVGHTHPLDTVDNITNKAGTDDGVTTTLTFTIPLANDANSQDFALAQDGTYWLIMTNGANGDDSVNSPTMPANRAKIQFQLF
jgi:hypothetical protein